MRTWCPELRAQRLGVRDCASSSLNTPPLQPDVQLSQQLELVQQIMCLQQVTGSILSLPLLSVCLREVIAYLCICLSSLLDYYC